MSSLKSLELEVENMVKGIRRGKPARLEVLLRGRTISTIVTSLMVVALLSPMVQEVDLVVALFSTELLSSQAWA